MVVVKWSACLPSTPTIRVRGDAYSFSVKFAFEKNENKQKRGRGWPIKKILESFFVLYPISKIIIIVCEISTEDSSVKLEESTFKACTY